VSDRWIKKGAFRRALRPMSAVELSLTDIMDKLVVDDGAVQERHVRQPARHVEARKIVGSDAHGGTRQIRLRQEEGPDEQGETILFGHAAQLSDIALATPCWRRRRAKGSAKDCVRLKSDFTTKDTKGTKEKIFLVFLVSFVVEPLF